MYRAVRIRAERIVAGEVDDISGYRHKEGRRETSPERSGPFMTRDLAEPIEGGGKVSTTGFVYRAVRC